MNKIFSSLTGWKNYIITNINTEEIAIKRAKECSDCSYAYLNNIIKMMVVDKIHDIEGYYCSKCSCPLSAKIRSVNEKCPIGKW